MQAAIYGLAGTELSADERGFFRDAKPAGYILFRRNIETREQLLRLTNSLRELEGHDGVAILIDQEGGRVARMRPPEWPAFPAAESFDKLYQLAPSSAIEAARVNARALGLMLVECGVTVDCLPLVDVRQEGASDIIGDRALGSEPMQVSALGRAQLDGLASAGVIGVVKHIPGHGRALVDSHLSLPVVGVSQVALRQSDFLPFQALRHAPFAMTAHVVFPELDPDRPATTSRRVIARTIRGELGIEGLLLSDDLAMNALQGDPAERALAALEAGCDLALHCTGRLEETRAVLGAVPPLAPSLAARLEGVMAAFAATPALPLDARAAEAQLVSLLAGAVA